MWKKFIPAFIATTLLVTSGWADVVFLINGETIEGRLIEQSPDSGKVIVKTKYGEQLYNREQVVAMVNIADAQIVRARLRAGRAYMRRNMMKEANLEFDVVLKINKKFQRLIDKYKEEHAMRAAEIERAFERHRPRPEPEPTAAAESGETESAGAESAPESEPEPEAKPEKGFFSKLLSNKIVLYGGGGVAIVILLMVMKKQKM